MSKKKQVSEEQEYSSVGAAQFSTVRDDLLYEFDIARVHSKSQVVQSYHGTIAEAVFRKWLSEFLPKRFAVTSGYLACQELTNETTLRHYDVIIYDQLQAPVLWASKSPDQSAHGRDRIIPVEYVHSIIEVKSQFTMATVKKAVKKLGEVDPYLAETNERGTALPRFFPDHFFKGCVFFERRKSRESLQKTLDEFLPLFNSRGVPGVIVLRDEYHPNESFRMWITRITEANPPEGRKNGSSTFDIGGIPTKFRLLGSGFAFAQYAFDLLAAMNGVYDARRLSSMHGITGLKRARSVKNA